MSSSALLSNNLFDKLVVNRLDAQTIKSDNILPFTPSYLFSALINNATFTRTERGGELTFNTNDSGSVIAFTDRPFRQTKYISFEEFVGLFTESGENSFEDDPPNGVLIHSEEQRTYIITLAKQEDDKITFNLELLKGETHNLNTIENSQMQLFLDYYE